MQQTASDYVIRVLSQPDEVDAQQWDSLLDQQTMPTPFMRHAYLAALHHSGSATPQTGWQPHFFLLEQGARLCAACVVYVKGHSYGEYVFDWAWAQAYERHGLRYYPKAVVAVPFTPVSGSRLLALTPAYRVGLMQAVRQWAAQKNLSSVHVLFGSAEDLQASTETGLLLRHNVQFHWSNDAPGYADFDHFLSSLTQKKRKKIKQERRKVTDAGVAFRWAQGVDIAAADWDFFYRCYTQTYLEHGNAPYLSADFFRRMAQTMPENWLLFVAERAGRAIASSLVAVQSRRVAATGVCDTLQSVAYGRYWGALERVDCLHFEACYYQPLQWCIAHGYLRFEGGAQGEYKMARALLPTKTSSAHGLMHPSFADAVARVLARENQSVDAYLRTAE